MDKFIGNNGRQDSEYDNIMSDYAEYHPPRRRWTDHWAVTAALAIVAVVPWITIAIYAVHRFFHRTFH